MAGVVRVEDSDRGDGHWSGGVERDLEGSQCWMIRPLLVNMSLPAHSDELPPSRRQHERDH